MTTRQQEAIKRIGLLSRIETHLQEVVHHSAIVTELLDDADIDFEANLMRNNTKGVKALLVWLKRLK